MGKNKALDMLADLQRENGVFINAYINHLRRLDSILFEIGQMGGISLTKEEIFDLLVENRALSSDLENLKPE